MYCMLSTDQSTTGFSRYMLPRRRLLKRIVRNAILNLICTVTGVPLFEIIKRFYVKGSQSSLRFSATNNTEFTLLQYYILLFGRYVWKHLCVYTRSDTYHTSLSHTNDYGNPVAIQNRNKSRFPLNEGLRQQTFEHHILDLTLPKHDTSVMLMITSDHSKILFFPVLDSKQVEHFL